MDDFLPGKGTQFNSVDSLAKRLGVSTEKLLEIASNAESHWIPGKVIMKSDGSPRKTHNAKPELKGIHNSIKEYILKPTYYPKFLHGALPKRSIYSNANHHTHKSVLINEDIADFYPSTSREVVSNIWKKFYRCSPDIASILADLTTYKGILPQGWICSSYLANLVFWESETDLYKNLSCEGFNYSRFADDISVSTRKHYSRDELTWVVSQIQSMFGKKGYRLKRAKHSIRTRSSRQLVNNQLVNNKEVGIPREERRRIRSAVNKLETAYDSGASDTEIYAHNWRIVSSRVGKLKSGHNKHYIRHRKTLMRIKP